MNNVWSWWYQNECLRPKIPRSPQGASTRQVKALLFMGLPCSTRCPVEHQISRDWFLDGSIAIGKSYKFHSTPLKFFSQLVRSVAVLIWCCCGPLIATQNNKKYLPRVDVVYGKVWDSLGRKKRDNRQLKKWIRGSRDGKLIAVGATFQVQGKPKSAPHQPLKNACLKFQKNTSKFQKSYKSQSAPSEDPIQHFKGSHKKTLRNGVRKTTTVRHLKPRVREGPTTQVQPTRSQT